MGRLREEEDNASEKEEALDFERAIPASQPKRTNWLLDAQPREYNDELLQAM